MKTFKKIAAVLCSLTMLPFEACVMSSTNSSESMIETGSSVSNADLIESSNDSGIEDVESLPPINLDLDHIKQHDDVELVSNFNYYNFADDEDSYLHLVMIVDDIVYFEKTTQVTENTADVYYYQYDLNTGESEKFEGYVAGFNMSYESYALVGNCIFFTIETLVEQVHYKVDLAAKTVTPLRSESFSPATVSFVFTYPIDETSYIETYYDIFGNNIVTHHVTLYTPAGEREIITKTADCSQEVTSYLAADGKIYEFSHRNSLSEAYITTYDTNGDPVSTQFLQKISGIPQAESDGIWQEFVPFGKYVAFSWRYQELRNTTYLYDMVNDEISLTGDYLFHHYSLSIVSSHILPVITYPKSGDPELQNLCFIDQTGSLTKLTGGLRYSYSVAFNDEVIVFLKEDQLYKATL